MGDNRYKKINQVLWIVLLLNIFVALIKIITGYIIKSGSLTADGFHSMTDSSSNVIGLFGIKLASKPVDEDHPYGHKKFETMAGLFIAVFLLILAGKVIPDAARNLTHPAAPQVTVESIIALVITLAINILVSKYEFKQGLILESDILISDSKHTKSDIFISIGVIMTLIGIKLGLPPIIDPIISLVVAGFILYASYEIINSTGKILLDKVAIDEEKIRDIVMEFKEVKGCHKIRSRGRNDDIYIDLHILIDPGMSVEESHTLTHGIEMKMREEFNKNVQVIVHIEPYYEFH
ncbi:MAG TPA: cation diffusion facilitator family transporter [Clostridiales bacterium]|nr:cation diffusion facilitator family transporter [Clostridiales bacterium]